MSEIQLLAILYPMGVGITLIKELLGVFLALFTVQVLMQFTDSTK